MCLITHNLPIASKSFFPKEMCLSLPAKLASGDSAASKISIFPSFLLDTKLSVTATVHNNVDVTVKRMGFNYMGITIWGSMEAVSV